MAQSPFENFSQAETVPQSKNAEAVVEEAPRAEGEGCMRLRQLRELYAALLKAVQGESSMDAGESLPEQVAEKITDIARSFPSEREEAQRRVREGKGSLSSRIGELDKEILQLDDTVQGLENQVLPPTS